MWNSYLVRVGICTESSYLFDMSAKTMMWLSPQNGVSVACTSYNCSFTRNRRSLRSEPRITWNIKFVHHRGAASGVFLDNCVRVNKTYLQKEDERYRLQTVLEQTMSQEPLVQDIYFDSLSLMKCTLSTRFLKCTCVISQARTNLLNSRLILGWKGSQVPRRLENPLGLLVSESF